MSKDIAKLKTPPFFIFKGLSNKLNLILTSLALQKKLLTSEDLKGRLKLPVPGLDRVK